MESPPLNPEFRINPENFHPCSLHITYSDLGHCNSLDQSLVYTVPVCT